MFGNAPSPSTAKPRRLLLVLVNGALLVAAIGALLSLVRGGIALAVIALSLLWIARLAVVHHGRLDRLAPAPEATLLLAILLVLYLGNGRTLGSGDTVPARLLPLSLVRERTFHLDRFEFLYAKCAPYYLAHVGGHYVSAYPVGAALVALPVFLPAALAGVPADSPVLAELEKLAAAAAVALSALLLYRGVSRIARRRTALLATAAYALGSSSFSVSSQALWQHGPSQLGLAAALYCLLRGRDQPSWVGLAGLPLSLAVITRPVDALIALALAVYVLWRHPRRLPAFALSALPLLAFQLWYGSRYFGDPFWTQWAPANLHVWRTPLAEGLAGLTLSPGRGLLVYSPIFALSLLGFALAWRRGGDPLLRVLSVVSGVMLVLYAKWEMWWGGYTLGPRLLADLTPALALGLAPLEGLLERHRGLVLAAAGLLGWSIAAHTVGAYTHDYVWNAHADIDRNPARLWSFTDNQLVNPFRRALARASLMRARVPTSRSAPELVAAEYTARLAPGSRVPARSPLELSLTAVNGGRAAWLAWPVDGDGVMKLGWRWRRPESGATVAGGARILYHDVAPGGSRDFQLRLDPPSAPGSYLLEIGLLRNGPGCASRIASPELRLDVIVTPSDTVPAPPAAAALTSCPVGSLVVDLPAPCGAVPAP